MNTPLLVTWKQFYIDCEHMIRQIQSSDKDYKYIVTIPKGGLVPAYYVGKILDLPVVTINLTSYTDNESGELQHAAVPGFTDSVTDPEHGLVVDDMYDSGKTINYLQSLYPKMDSAVVYARFDDHHATYAGVVLGHEQWLDFPWEVRFDGENQRPSLG